jgi:hypothetical protein
MRVVKELSDPRFRITIFSWNNKYLVKFETPFLEQTYKVKELDLTGDGDIEKLIADKEFLSFVEKNFQQMQSVLYSSLEKI